MDIKKSVEIKYTKDEIKDLVIADLKAKGIFNEGDKISYFRDEQKFDDYDGPGQASLIWTAVALSIDKKN